MLLGSKTLFSDYHFPTLVQADLINSGVPLLSLPGLALSWGAVRESLRSMRAGSHRGSSCSRCADRSVPHSTSLTAGPLCAQIISKLLQEQDACHEMLSVKVRSLQNCQTLDFSATVCGISYSWQQVYMFDSLCIASPAFIEGI